MARKNLGVDLGPLHTALAAELLKRVQNGTASAADLAVARAFLRDNRIEADPQHPSKPLFDLSEALEDLELDLPN